jgi:hypothetical protein
MTILQRIRDWLCGEAEDPAETSPAIQLMQRNLEETVALKRDVKRIRESGIWPADMVRGVYRPERREHHADE